MKTQELAKQEVLELEIDFDTLVSDFEQSEDFYPVLEELESDNYYFDITFEVNGSNVSSSAGWCDYNDPILINFSGEIVPCQIIAFDKETEQEFELRITNQIKEQLKTVR
jgi:hypothetical protein